MKNQQMTSTDQTANNRNVPIQRELTARLFGLIRLRKAQVDEQVMTSQSLS